MWGDTGIQRALAALVVPGVAVLCLALVWRRRGPEDAWPAAAVAAGAASVTVSGSAWAFGQWAEEDRLAALTSLVELAALLGLVLFALRHGRKWAALASAAALGSAVACWPSRFAPFEVPDDLLDFTGFSAILVIPVGFAARYLRALDKARLRSVDAARRAQRMELAHDLHDFVAHDVTGMVALAQAGTVLAASDPVAATALFERIEQAGQQALGSLDRTVHLLRTADEEREAERVPQPGLEELSALVERFAGSGHTAVHLEVPPEGAQVPREVAATAYRIVVEALTNVRRHAPGAREVTARVHRVGGRLEVTVTDDGTGVSPAAGARRGGSGLAGLAARVEALGGTLTAARSEGGWQVVATMPVEGR